MYLQPRLSGGKNGPSGYTFRISSSGFSASVIRGRLLIDGGLKDLYHLVHHVCCNGAFLGAVGYGNDSCIVLSMNYGLR